MAARKPARKATPKATSKRPVKAFKPKPTPKTATRAKGRPTCPVCGSRDVEVARPKAKAKAAGKLEAGVVAPLIVDRHEGLTCRSCGFREEAA